jgi:predicted Zn-dependent protease
MLKQITDALGRRKDLKGWTVRHVTSREAQLYGVPTTLESRRLVEQERFILSVLRETGSPDGSAACGVGEITLLPGDDIAASIEVAVQTAGLMHNPPYSLPEPAEMPEVALADPLIQADPVAVADDLMIRLYAAPIPSPLLRMTAAECYVEEETTRLVNSRGIDAVQVATRADIEWVLIARRGEDETESFVFFTRRRAADLNLEQVMAQQAQYAVDLLDAGPAPDFEGPVVMRGATLEVFFMANEISGGPLQVLSSAQAKYNKHSTWEIGKSIYRKEPSGDPLRMWATRRLPYGTHAARFDEQGVPAQRVEMVRDGKLMTFVASQRHAEYLGIPATGPFGDVELPPGPTPAKELLGGRYVEVVTFSWFNPDPMRGEFATEIRLGYLVEDGRRKPFRGGQLIGNLLDALADARWSRETGFHGSYQGPIAARFAGLRVSGKGSA